MTRTICALILVVGCASPTPPEVGDAVVPGEGIGAARLEMRYAEVREALGEPQGEFINQRLGFARFADGIELVLASPEAGSIVDEAIVVGVGASEATRLAGTVVPGASRASVEAELGPAPDVTESLEFYPQGLSLEYDGDVVLRVGVVPPYERHPDVPPMRSATE